MYWLLFFVCSVAHQPSVISFSGDFSNECADNEFQCSTGECVPIGSVCNNGIDSADNHEGSIGRCSLNNDAEGTAGGCFNDDFTCDNGQCIPLRWRCDNFDDCIDRSDENGCSDFNTIGSVIDATMNPDYFTSCEPDEFTCYNGQCIISSYVCDNFGDCVDGSDEFSCPVTPTDYQINTPIEPDFSSSCEPDKFTCYNGQCIPSIFVCDNFSDCFDGSDEFSCPVTPTDYQINYTPSEPDDPCAYLYCLNSGKCTISWLANEASCDCPKGFDGEYCEKDLCAELNCQNSGECKIFQLLWVHKAYCECQKGFAGTRCEQDLCANHGCSNGGQCEISWLKKARCRCPDGYKGKHCEEECGNSWFQFGC